MKKLYLLLATLLLTLVILTQKTNPARIEASTKEKMLPLIFTALPPAGRSKREGDDPIIPIEPVSFVDYLKIRLACIRAAGCPCMCLKKANARSMMMTDDEKTSEIKKLFDHGVLTNSKLGKKLMRGRWAHGTALTIFSLSFVPLSILIARYFKETWVAQAFARYFHRWLILHIGLAVLGVTAFAFGHQSLAYEKSLIGHSLQKASNIHIVLGYSAFVIFLIAIITGPFRLFEITDRKMYLFGHAFIGIVQYVIGLIALLASSYIPASPSSDDTVCFDDEDFLSKSVSVLLQPVIWWILVDIAFHSLLSCLQIWADRKLGYQRPMYFPLIPVIPISAHHDNKGFRYRKVLLFMYLIINAGIQASIIMGIFYFNCEAGCSYGPMQCKYIPDFVHKSADAEGECGFRETGRDNGQLKDSKLNELIEN